MRWLILTTNSLISSRISNRDTIYYCSAACFIKRFFAEIKSKPDFGLFVIAVFLSSFYTNKRVQTSKTFEYIMKGNGNFHGAFSVPEFSHFPEISEFFSITVAVSELSTENFTVTSSISWLREFCSRIFTIIFPLNVRFTGPYIGGYLQSCN